MKKLPPIFVLLMLVAVLFPISSASAADTVSLSKGQTLYVPAYSHIYAGNRELEILVTVMLSVRNTDAKYGISITSVEYYGSKGQRLKQYLDRPLVLGPFASTRYVIHQKDKSGGSGANFLVEWKAEKDVNPPIVESVMIGAGLHR